VSGRVRPLRAVPRDRLMPAAEPRRAARRWMWMVLTVGALLIPFLSVAGRYVPDTRDAVWFSPWTYLSRSFWLWQPSPVLGHEQHDGIIVPMAAVVSALRGTGLPVWVAERLWHGLLLLVAGAGMVGLVDQLTGRRRVAGPLAAAAAYTMTPYAFSYGLSTTGAFLPYVLLPTLLLVTAKGLGRWTIGWSALFGVVTFLMGGGNGAPQLYAGVVVVAYAAWMVWIDRSVPLSRALRFFGWALLFAIGLNAYWVISFASSNVSNILAFSEQPRVINVASSYSESIRGLGFWVYYGGDQAGPWAPTVRPFITSPALIFTGFAIPVVALLSAWLIRWRYRLLFLFMMIASLVVMVGTFPVDHPTPFGRFLLFAYAHVPGAAGLRTTYKLGEAMYLAVAVLVGIGVDQGWRRLRRRPASGPRVLAVAVALVVLAGTTYPVWSGTLYARPNSAGAIPGYWDRALSTLKSREGTTYRAFFAPASAPLYRWGRLRDGIAESFPELSSVHPNRIPLGERFGSNLLAAIEHIYQGGVRSENSANLFRYLGVRDVVLQNDLDWERARTARPTDLQRLAADPSLQPLRLFGEPGRNVVPPGPPTGLFRQLTANERALSPVQVLTVPGARPVVQAQAGPAAVVSGDGFGLVELARLGKLERQPPVLYSGTLTPDEIARLVSQGASFYVTDTNRRRAWSFTGLRRNNSYTLPGSQTLGTPGSIAYGLFGGRVDAQTVAVYDGVRNISASGYGSSLVQTPEFRPVNAFDGNRNSWWLVGILGNPVGQWVRVDFYKPRLLSGVRLSLPPLGFARQVSAVRLEFSDGTSVRATLRPGFTDIAFPPRSSSFLRVRITAVTNLAAPNGVGFAEIQLPLVRAREYIQTPIDLFEAARRTPGGLSVLAGSPLTYLFRRSQTDQPLERDEETGILRRFFVPNQRSLMLEGTVTLDPDASDEAIDQLLRGKTDIVGSSTSRRLRNPNNRASSAIDGQPGTAWVPSGNVGERLTLRFPERSIDHLVIHALAGGDRSHITQVEVGFSGGSGLTRWVPADGVLSMSFPPVKTSAVVITIKRVKRVTAGGTTLPVGISEVEIPNVQLTPIQSRAKLPCFSSPNFTIDGKQVPIRPKGSAGPLLFGTPLGIETCTGGPVDVDPGWHLLVGQGILQPDTLTLSGEGVEARQESSAPPVIRTRWLGGGSYDVAVQNATVPFYLSIGQNFSRAWTATIEAEPLPGPFVLGGYSAGWRVDRTGSYTIRVRYPPQGRATMGFVVSGLSLLGVVLVFAVPFSRRRRVRRRSE
jgi:arabinofuranan 3-O-arabinosyltransferase